jgi:hypothetical protein
MELTTDTLLGEWRQIDPPTGADSIFLTFEIEGRLLWRIEGEATVSIVLAWALHDGMLMSQTPDGVEQHYALQAETPARFSFQRGNETYRYERVPTSPV